jgi:7,8-dihydropterin-6-yl-methyl-4-(beta-D-ribofuranosyl)aminobenzene 5'-phosphate synthase
MTIRITTLTENTAGWVHLLAEWGLSMLVETEECRILADTGTSFVAAHNANVMGVDLSRVDRVFFSHGHFDHTGGLLDALKLMKKDVEVIAHPDIWAEKYYLNRERKACSYNAADKYEYIGVPYSREEAEKFGACFNLTGEPVWITDNIVTSGEIPMLTDYETIDPDLYVREDGEFKHDPLPDDQSLFIKSDRGLVVVAGCAHRGIVNVLNRARQLTGVESVYAVIGGTHLAPASPERLKLTIAELKRLGVQKVAASHCTGLPAACLLAREFGDSFLFNNVGTRITI